MELKKYFIYIPHPLRCLFASLYGIKLNYLRYGKETEKLVNDCFEREYWERSRIEKYQVETLVNMLKKACQEVPFFKNQEFLEFTRKIENNGLSELKNFPTISKPKLKQNQKLFICEKYHKRPIHHIYTSGTTGTPLKIFFTKETCRKWYALFEARWRRWNKINRYEKWAIIGGKNIVAINQKQPPFWIWNIKMKQLYISAYHIAPWSVKSIVEALKKYDVRYLWAYGSAVTSLSNFIIEQGLEPPHLKCIICNAEPLFEFQKKIIYQAFKTKILNTYGMAEMVCGASECEYGNMHLWEDACIPEVIGADDKNSNMQEQGKLISTGLLNKEMPLIRYETGDLAVIERKSQDCFCGRKLRILKSVEGRMDEIIMTPDGRQIGRLDTVFKSDFPILKAQIIQEDFDVIRVIIVPFDGYSNEVKNQICFSIREKIGNSMRIFVEEKEEIPLSLNGKFRTVISKIKK